ncbi:MAG: hypothetical protein K8953_01915, partial [Proteobacteria bacterium]|nr:hypothetical protein [Pseudomonadota bacterium]
MNDTASTPLCAPAITAHSCIDNPFAEACAANEDFKDYITDARDMRTTYCQANPDKTEFCAESVKFNNICKDNTDVFNTLCIDDSVARETACQTHGTGAGGHATCADILVAPCTSDPFTNPNCDDATDISGIRTKYCGEPTTAWHDDCNIVTYPQATDARNTACLEYGVDTTKGGHARCAGRPNVLRECSSLMPFSHPVCDEVGDITMKRTTYCEMPANAFMTVCKTDGTHGGVDTARDMACLMGLSTATGCAERDNVKSACITAPLIEQNAGCANLPNHGELLSGFCAIGNNVMTHSEECSKTASAVCPTDAFNPSLTIADSEPINCLMDV